MHAKFMIPKYYMSLFNYICFPASSTTFAFSLRTEAVGPLGRFEGSGSGSA
jgi:hypothetical protein